ncbi:hypothetical protein I3843_01G182700 [Carya illinoinensis]|nr:uncharacterized protein LOC122277512 isoform X2 [Carya illinoinensis]XP_042943467.1 uncharacterized protein LOC122277512 isoform X2 [Carya illinoinensis]XP_042943476.1 uncharacterized protein LOC122277512 isoform X2 [Carya illinoinensis]KAG2728041.1 hypothetical protein I3760_01G187400 [Carya illinoinensis]KAG2728042.1 hypothetical protein I3760_01G187400 [Carya illinoinensis]KAG2728043.1 hypothetical protein I3760_01G187400 [Carya illinoinensis]KAG2728044.1 hypothetical protein I3760_01G1
MEKPNPIPVSISASPIKDSIQPKINMHDENIEPGVDLRLALGDSNQCTQRQLKDESDAGAGTNAGSRIDMTLVASELVWSPHEGLSLKCADFGFANKKGSLMWGAGPSNVAFSLPQNITSERSTTGKPTDVEVITQQAAFHANSKLSGTNTITRSPANDADIMLGCGPNHVDETGKVNGRNFDSLSIKTDEPKPDVMVNELFTADPTGGGRDLGSEQILGMNIVLTSDVHPGDECNASETPDKNFRSPGRRPLAKPEQTAENELQTPICENDCGGAAEMVESEFAPKLENTFKHYGAIRPRNKYFPSNLSPTNNRIYRNQRKGKEKAVSDGDVNERSSKEGDDSHESVESCNSAGLLSSGKKRQSFDEHLLVGSKRVKNQIQETPSSAPYIRQDSSFMNWISNMMKGFSKPIQTETASPALAIAPPDLDLPDQNPLTCNKNQDPVLKNIGFRSIFQSLYGPKMEGETSLNRAHEKGEGSKELELANKMCIINTTPIAIQGDGDNICKRFLLPNEKFEESISGNGAALATQPRVFPVNFAPGQENSKTISREDKNSCRVESSKEKNVISSNSSLGKDKTKSGEKIASDAPSEGKTTNDFSYRNDPMGSLWVTRLCSKTCRPVLNLGDHNPSIGVGLDSSSDCIRLLPRAGNHKGFSKNHNGVAVKENSVENPMLALGEESQKCPADTEAIIGSERIKCHNSQNSAYKLNLILPSPKFRSSEAMASMFARRLDTLKHSILSNVTDNASRETTTCIFCGIKGHCLQECSAIKESEIEDLLRNVYTYNGTEEWPCLCIKCFQLNHWAIACPSASSKGEHQTKGGASLVGPSKMQHNENLKLLTGWERPFQDSCDGSYLRKPEHGNWKQNETITPEKTGNANSLTKYIASSFGGNYSKEQKIIPVNGQVSDVPKGIFDAIKSLRLSRSDILEWMNSHASLSHLDGFFLRLRLGKWEEGLGGTGYHVACITGKQRENSPENAKYSVRVNVGGIKCLVESHYISNHDFLEDELMAWWCATSRDGGKIPSEEELRVKFKKKRMLGF